MKLNLVDSDELLLNKGDALVISGKKGVAQLIIVCPGCGKVSSTRGNHVYDENSKSYTPSIVHDMKYGGCGWHGWLIKGEFTECQ